LGNFFRQRTKRLAAALKSGLVSRPVRETLALSILDGQRRTFPIGNAEGRAVIVAEIKFREIAMQVLFLAMLVGAAHSALEH
jgi:hypothetical protein